MNRRELLARCSATPEERQLLSHTLDQIAAAQRGQLTHTAFLTPAQRLAAERLMEAAGRPRHRFLGGYPEAERKLCVFLPEWMEEEDVVAEDFLTALRATWYAQETLTHRDFLGALMGMGVRRETVGDILVSPGSCDILLLPEVTPFLLQSLDQAGRSRLHVSQVALSALHFPEPRRRELHATVAALRLDAVAAAGFSLSRTKLAGDISAGRVTLNWQTVLKGDHPVAEGDVIACRGLGKCRLTRVGGLSRKGRVNVTLERYL